MNENETLKLSGKHEEWCCDPALSRPADRCTCAITPEQQAAEAAHTGGFWRLGRADQRRHLLDAHQVNAPRPGGTDLIALHNRAHAAGHDDGNRIDVYGIANPEVD